MRPSSCRAHEAATVRRHYSRSPELLCVRCSCGSAPVPEDATAFAKTFPYRLRIVMSSIAVRPTTTPSGARYAYGILFNNGIQRPPTAACTAAGFVELCFELLPIRFCELVVAIGAAGGRSTARRRPTTTRLRAQSKFTISTSGDEVKRSHQTHAPNVTGALLVDGGLPQQHAKRRGNAREAQGMK